MTRFIIDYDEKEFDAVLSCSEGGRHWEAIRRVCEEKNSDDVKVLSSTQLRMPWWEFLNCRKAIKYHVDKYNLDIDASSRAVFLLKEVNNSEEKISDASSIPPLSDQQILNLLSDKLNNRILKPYQLRNVAKLARLKVGATFSVPGAGKTTEALAFYALLATSDSRLLVIAPKNAFATWEEQIGFWNIPHQFVRLTGGTMAIQKILNKKKPVLMLITYQQFPIVTGVVTNYLKHYPNSFIFLDESHKIKSGTNGVIASSILRISHLVPNKLIMSGTPLPNSVSDLIPQLLFLTPGINAKVENAKSLIEPLYVRTCKSELGLPYPKRIEIPIPLAPMQRYLYNQIRSEIALQANKMLNSRNRQEFRRIGRSALLLLQFVSNPALLAKKDFHHDALLSEVLDEGDSPKIVYTCNRARQLASKEKKVIIWSSFVENVEIIAERLSDLGADYIHGKVEASTDLEADSREAKIKRFHDDKRAMVLVANPAACSEGISLHTICHHAIYVDRNYNAAQYLQSEDRIHRIGQNEAPTIEILTCPDTIDNSVSTRLDEKIKLMGDVLNDHDLKYRSISFDLDQEELDDQDISSLLQHLRGEI